MSHDVLRQSKSAPDKIATPCPVCGHQSLFVGSNGYLTCGYFRCPCPDLDGWIDRAKDDLTYYARAKQQLAEAESALTRANTVAELAIRELETLVALKKLVSALKGDAA